MDVLKPCIKLAGQVSLGAGATGGAIALTANPVGLAIFGVAAVALLGVAGAAYCIDRANSRALPGSEEAPMLEASKRLRLTQR